jgi:predicted RNase H-like HicB family nuclease
MSRKARVRGRKFTVVLDKDEDGGYSVQCVELPAAISQGDTKKEALKNIKEAIELVLEVLEEKVRKRKPKSELEEVVV